MRWITDQKYLREQQYAVPDCLNARRRVHMLYSTNPYGWMHFVYDHLSLRAGMVVLEIGCGTGGLWRENLERIPAGVKFILADLSNGMVSEVRQALQPDKRFNYLVSDAQSAPFPSGKFDVVIANHMLYHVPDMGCAVRELARMLKPGGILCAATNGNGHMQELYDLIRIVLPSFASETGQLRYRLENADQVLSSTFAQVTVIPYEDRLEITASQPLIDYILSMWDTQEIGQSDLCKLQRIVDEQIATKGSFTIHKSAGVVVAMRG